MKGVLLVYSSFATRSSLLVYSRMRGFVNSLFVVRSSLFVDLCMWRFVLLMEMVGYANYSLFVWCFWA